MKAEMVVGGDAFVSQIGWVAIPRSDLSGWNDRLLSTDAHYRQYPYWCEPYENEGNFTPRFYVYRSNLGDAAYVCILERKALGIKFGLVFRGPVALGPEPLSDHILQDLFKFARESSFVFLRITNRSERITQQLLRLPNTEQVESFPFYRDPPRSLIVTQAETDEATLSSFQTVARRNIRAAEKAGYVIERSDSPDDYAKVWPMFERLSERKGFDLSNRNLAAWLEVVENARKQGCSTLFSASLDGICVSAIHLLRYGQMTEFMLGALDLSLLGKNPSPSALLHWTAMREAYRSGSKYYNLGGPGDGVRNKVYPFKRKFRPEFLQAEPPVTVKLDHFKYRLWDLAVLKVWLGLRTQIRRVAGKGSDIFNMTLEKFRERSVHNDGTED